MYHIILTSEENFSQSRPIMKSTSGHMGASFGFVCACSDDEGHLLQYSMTTAQQLYTEIKC